MMRLRVSGLRSAVAVFALALPVISAALLPCATYAQQQRVVQGKVFGPNDEPRPGAVVYLKDMKTLGMKSFISTPDGSYHFGQLADAADYEVWAELDGKKSPTRGVSSFDQKKQYIINLKLGK
jgi:hypothetical protein